MVYAALNSVTVISRRVRVTCRSDVYRFGKTNEHEYGADWHRNIIRAN